MRSPAERLAASRALADRHARERSPVSACCTALLAGRGGDEPQTTDAEERRGYYLTDATLTEMGADGTPRLVVRAKNIEQQLSDQSVLLTDLKLDYRTDTNDIWTVTSRRRAHAAGSDARCCSRATSS